MPKGLKWSFSSFRGWFKINYITFINALVTIILVAAVVVVLLTRSAILQRETTEDAMISLAGRAASDIQAHYSTYLSPIQTLARMMGDFQFIEPEQRREIFNNLMLGMLNVNNNIMSVYTVWEPNLLDGMDAEFASTLGSDETGQFLSGFTRERGWVEQRIFPEYKPLLDIDYSVASNSNGIVTEPEFRRTGGSGNIWLFEIQLPIVSSAYLDNRVVGVVGATIEIRQLQEHVRSIIPYELGRAILYSENGTIIAHSDPRWQGNTIASFVAYSTELWFMQESHNQMIDSMVSAITDRRYVLRSTNNLLLVSYPVRISDPNATSMSIGSRTGSPPWAVVTVIPMSVVMAPIYTLLRFSILFIIGAGALAAFVVFLTSRSITQQARDMQRSLEHSTAMNDSLKYGLFLIDGNYVIHGAYTKALEKILSVSELQGKSFIDLLSSSLKGTEMQGVMDYLEMVFKGTFDKEMLETINPLDEFVYRESAASDTKVLRAGFSLAEQKGGVKYILVTLEDISAEKELSKQLREADAIRESEMRSLFQVIQLDPGVLRDFVADAEYEFENINDILKNRKSLQQEVLIEMYQSIHAIKSNALILNLESFASRLHKLENSVKNLRELHRDDIPFDDFLGLILELNDSMKEMDQVKETVLKIENFRVMSAGEKNQERYVLVETLNRVCDKTQAALDKKVRFVVEEIDDAALAYGPRRAIKEMLTQLVRNAIYHGIETPAERGPLGKEAEGEVRLSIKQKNNQIVMKITDDGAGIDFDRVRQAAGASNQFNNNGAARDKNYLLKVLFSPGFSTLEGHADVHAGRGIGLSLVKDRVKELHGNITVSTAEGKGTTFTITLPLEMSEAVKAS